MQRAKRFVSTTSIREKAWAMPLTSPAFPRGPYYFTNREYLVVTYRSDRAALQCAVPAPLRLPDDPLVQMSFMHTPDSTGFGSYTAVSQSINVVHHNEQDGGVTQGRFLVSLFVDDDSPIAAGREIWGMGSKLADPKLRVERDCLVGTLNVASVNVAVGTCGFKHATADVKQVKEMLKVPQFTLKVIPHVDCSPRVLQLVQYSLQDVTVKGAWCGPGALTVHAHAMADVSRFPVREVISAHHIVADSILGLGKVVKDYLKKD